jgi:hypothetical protein
MAEEIRTDSRPAMDRIERHFEALKARALSIEEWKIYDEQQRKAEADLLMSVCNAHLFGE